MINWSAFLEPELWAILVRIVWTLIKLIIILWVWVMMALAFWNGYKIDIGSEGNSVHIYWEQYPLKRFFK